MEGRAGSVCVRGGLLVLQTRRKDLGGGGGVGVDEQHERRINEGAILKRGVGRNGLPLVDDERDRCLRLQKEPSHVDAAGKVAAQEGTGSLPKSKAEERLQDAMKFSKTYVEGL